VFLLAAVLVCDIAAGGRDYGATWMSASFWCTMIIDANCGETVIAVVVPEYVGTVQILSEAN
jgi:hypothetical protein